MMQSSLINLDFDGTCTIESGIEIARLVEKEEKAKISCCNLLRETDRYLDRATNAYDFEEYTEKMCNYHLREGAKWLKGYPESMLSRVQCPPSVYMKEIIRRIKESGGVKLISRTDRRIAKNFFDQFEETRNNCEIICNELRVNKQRNFTGTFSNMISKGLCYIAGDVISDSPWDIGLYNRANNQGYRVYLVDNGEKTSLARKVLKKFKIPSLPFP